MKVVIVTNIPNHYRIPLFNELYYQLSKKEIKLTVIFGAEGYDARKNKNDLTKCKFPYHVLSGRKSKSVAINYQKLFKYLRSIKPDKIIVAGFNLGTLKSLFYSKFYRKQLILWTGTVDIGVVKSSTLKRLYRKLLIPFFDHYITYGSAAKEYLVTLGAQVSKVSAVGNTVDIARLSEQVEKIKIDHSSEVNRLLYVGYLSSRKNVSLLLPIIKKLRNEESNFVLDIVGDGNCKISLQQEVERLGLKDFVVFHGFKQREELPQFLAQADIFLFQTDGDIWGLVLNEAMSAGLPVIVSEHAAAIKDIISEGENGLVVNFRNTEEVTEKIKWLFDYPNDAQRIGKQAKDFILENYSINAVAQRFYKVIAE